MVGKDGVDSMWQARLRLLDYTHSLNTLTHPRRPAGLSDHRVKCTGEEDEPALLRVCGKRGLQNVE